MPINGSEAMTDPWGTIFSPFTNMFSDILGNPNAGGVFFLIPIIVVTFTLHIKVKNPVMTSMFMLGTGALLGAGNLFVGATTMAVIFTIFSAIGLVGLFTSLLFQR